MNGQPKIVFLGPQRRTPNVLDALRSLPGVDARAPVAIVSAGWEEREREQEEFEQHIRGRAINLEVYHRVEEIYTRDPAFRAAVRDRHDRLRALQRFYRDRLAYALDGARQLLAAEGDEDLVGPEREAAIEAVRAIDAHHFHRIQQIHAEFQQRLPYGRHQLVQAYRDQLRRQVADCSVLCIAGGHVAILLNRLRISGLLAIWPQDRPIVAWGAGAMALCERVVLFHDSPPQGPGNAEVLEMGLGVAEGIVPLPHATERMHLDDANRVTLFARRFGPAACVALDDGARVDWDGSTWSGAPQLRQLRATGEVAEVTV